MFRLVVLLTLVAQTLQLFACCENCCADTSAATPLVAEAPKCCRHHHASDARKEAPNVPRRPAHPDDSHHVCLATHVFYVRDARGETAEATGELEFAQLPTVTSPRLSPVPHVGLSGQRNLQPALLVARSRSALGVYLL
jgi:hypothetical protein